MMWLLQSLASRRNASSPDRNATTQEIRQHCLSRQGMKDSDTIILFSILLVLFIIFFILAKKSSRKRYSIPLSFIHTTFAIFLVLTFLPFAIYDFIDRIPL